jgi:hypothetical protein
MFNEMGRLRDSPPLLELLTHYATLAAPDRQVWQDRRMSQDGRSPRELTGLHGELIAYGWLEQNTGETPALRAGELPQSYRVTPAGLRALKQLRSAARA